MNRVYLEEDLQLIRAYFPGATTVSLRTPFDLTQRQHQPRLDPVNFRDTDDQPGGWKGEIAWTN